MRFSDLDGLSIGVWGAGVETRSFATHVARRLPRANIGVVVLESPADAPELTDGARIADAAGAPEALRTCDVLVRSPGVSIHRPELRAIAARGVPITTPTGLWMAERGGRRVIGITATKGKSTTAALTAHLARHAGVAVQLAGNIGRPALDLLDDEDDLAVIELSSYQIADLVAGPEIAVASNLYPEHLQWHVTHEAYREEKLRLLTLPGVRACVLNAASPDVMSAPRVCSECHRFGDETGWHTVPDGVAWRGDLRVAAADLPLPGPHNAVNVCAALTALEAAGVLAPPLPEALADFEGLPHRLQEVHRADGIVWVDDSISTVPQAAMFAVESFPGRRIVLIGGGFDRGQDYGELAESLAAREVVVIGLPDTGGRLLAALREAGAPPERALSADTLEDAVETAREHAAAGTVVLLSPAAPSHNAFRDFEERGDRFRELARGADHAT